MKNYILLITFSLIFFGCGIKIIKKDSNLSKEIQIKHYIDDLAKSKEYVGLQYIVFDKNGKIFSHSAGKRTLM